MWCELVRNHYLLLVKITDDEAFVVAQEVVSNKMTKNILQFRITPEYWNVD